MFRFQFWVILILHLWVSACHPNHETKLPNEIIRFCSERAKWKPVAQSVIEKIFGGKEYVLTNCVTSLALKLNYVVVLDPSNKPVNLSSYASEDVINVNQIELKPYNKILVVQELPKEFLAEYTNFVVNTNLTVFFESVLEQLGLKVVFLDCYKLKQIDDFSGSEIYKYILFKIETKLGYINVELKQDLSGRPIMNL